MNHFLPGFYFYYFTFLPFLFGFPFSFKISFFCLSFFFLFFKFFFFSFYLHFPFSFIFFLSLSFCEHLSNSWIISEILNIFGIHNCFLKSWMFFEIANIFQIHDCFHKVPDILWNHEHFSNLWTFFGNFWFSEQFLNRQTYFWNLGTNFEIHEHLFCLDEHFVKCMDSFLLSEQFWIDQLFFEIGEQILKFRIFWVFVNIF